MSCGGVRPRFRLLDAYVGWDPASVDASLIGLDDPTGLSLAQRRPGAISPALLWSRMFPARLSASCRSCHWFLLAPAPDGRILQRGPCRAECAPFEPLHGWAGQQGAFVDPVAIAEGPRGLAVADPGSDRVWMLPWQRGASPIELFVEQPGPLAFDGIGVLYVARGGELRRFDPIGAELAPLSGPPITAAIVALRVLGDSLWAAVDLPAGEWAVWRLDLAEADASWVLASEDELAGLAPTGVVAVSPRGFCLAEPGPEGVPITCCHDWYGRALEHGAISQALAPEHERSGRLLTTAIDSGVPRCRWHRVRIDAQLPFGTAIEVEVATADSPDATPHSRDWTGPRRAEGARDFLIDQPPGRWLFLRLTLRGDGHTTPMVRRVRLDFPRATSFDQLPEVYRQTPEAEDFGERFLALFDAELESFDRAIERLPSLFELESTPSELLPWLASFLGLSLDPSWDEQRRRRLIAAAPDLYRRRGTVDGLRDILRLLTDVEPLILEPGLERPWAGLGGRATGDGGARLGAVRLFGRSRARVRLGSSRLGTAPIRSYGNPEDDAVTDGAWRLRVSVPPHPGQSSTQLRERIEQIVEQHKPAHTVVSVRVGGSGFVLGSSAALGIDTILTPLPAPILGANGNVRLRQATVLWPRRGPS